MKTKLRLCKLLFSTRLFVSLLIILGILEGLQWLQGEGKSSKSLLLSDYPELSSSSMMSSSSSNFASSAHLPETALPASEMTKVKMEPEKKSTHTHQNILLLAYARSGKLYIRDGKGRFFHGAWQGKAENLWGGAGRGGGLDLWGKANTACIS